MAWQLTADRPIYIQLMERIELDIVSGRYQPGEKLKSVRDLAAEASVNPNTMQKALAELEQKCLVFAQRTSGRTITEDIGMVEQLRKQLARDQVSEFLEKMKALGYPREELLALIRDLAEEGE